MLLAFIQEVLRLANLLPWLAPLAVSSLTGALSGWGSFRFWQGALAQRVASIEKQIERDAIHSTEEHSGLVTRHEFNLMREDIREMRADVRELLKGRSRR